MKLRVLHIVPNFGNGGAERRVSDLLKLTDKNRFEVMACSLFSPSGTQLEEELMDANVRIEWLDKRLGPDLRMLPAIGRLLRGFSPHVVHTHRYVLRYSLLPTVFRKVPVRVHTVCNQAEHEVDRPGILVHRLAFSRFGVVPISISKQIERSVKDLYGPVESRVIPNAVDTNLFKPETSAREEQRTQMGIKDQPLLLHIGRFQKQKNHRLLIDVFSKVKERNHEAILALVGDGPLRPEIASLVRERGLDDSVLFLGVRKDIPQLLAAADIFVLSSDWEGVPRSALEAMAAGKPIVSTSVGGVPDIIEHGVTGLLAPANDPKSLAHSIIRLTGDPALRSALGNRAAEAAKRFDVRQTTKDYEALYSELWQPHAGQGRR